MSRLGRWFLAIRPKTLGISVAPVLVGSTLAYAESGQLRWPAASAALVAALLIQIGTNLYNDAADYERGTDTQERLGPERASAQGWFTPNEVKRGAHLCFVLAFCIGIYLVAVGGWPIVLIGLLSIAAGYAYTGGPRPIAYSATGELFVFLFFGLAAVMGSYYLQTLRIGLNAFLCASALGLLAAAVLMVNNYRDQETDARTHKLTLTHYLGRHRSRTIYALLLLLPFLLPLLLTGVGATVWLTVVLLPLALRLLHDFIREEPGPIFNTYLANTARLQLAYAVLLSIGLYIH